jgi:hypothetical protein
MVEAAMSKFGHVLISGIVWIVIAIGVGVLGSWLITPARGWPILGWPLAIIGFGFAGMSALHLWRMTSLQMQGLRMMRDNPEGFQEAKRRYEDAMRRIDDEET